MRRTILTILSAVIGGSVGYGIWYIMLLMPKEFELGFFIGVSASVSQYIYRSLFHYKENH